jgi:hypothetical protein
MGIGVHATCPCGAKVTLALGPALKPPPRCLFPFLCRACSGVSIGDVAGDGPACDHCGGADVVPYGDPAACRAVGPTVVLDCASSGTAWPAASLRLTDGSYFCPTCAGATLTFASAGMSWD